VTHRGHGTLSISTTAKAGMIRLEVGDDGPGMTTEVLGKIFDPFFTTKGVGKGTGLGLSICDGIIKEHGGSIEATSTPGVGTLFTIELPVVAGRQIAPKAKRAAPRPTAPATILVVDDEVSIRELVRDTLETRGHTVDVAESGEKALEAIAAKRYDLLVSDLKMPEMSGQELYARVQAEHPDLAKRVLFTSGDTVSLETKAFLERVGRPFLLKPFQVADLVEEVERILAPGPEATSP